MKVVVTAGPTREYLDPVRFLSNPSTGRMGFAVAAEAARLGHEVTLIAGPVSLKTPKGVHRVDVVSAREMLTASCAALAKVKRGETVAFISSAAIADWRPAVCASQKLKKRQMTGVLKLVRNPDILKTLNRRRRALVPASARLVLVGFAAETGDALAEAARKCREKWLAFVVANDVTRPGAGFGTPTNQVAIVFPDGAAEQLPLMSKRRVAAAILKTLGRVLP